MGSRTRLSVRGKLGLSVLAVAVAAPLFGASSASAVELNGGWAPFNRCPVDDPLVLNTDGIANGGSGGICLAASSPNGSIKIGKMAATATGATNLQAGGSIAGETVTFAEGTGGTIIADPVTVKGGLLNIMCGGPHPNQVANLVRTLCRTLIEDNPLNKVTATVKAVGPPTDFDIIAGLLTDIPIMTLPVKIQLNNPILGGNCSIGSSQDPIVLHPQNTAPIAGGEFGNWKLNGDPGDGDDALTSIITFGATQGDSTFSVPKANGCGPLNLLSGALNARVGLPSPSGNNELVLNDVEAGLMVPFLSEGEIPGPVFAQGWHSAVLP